MLYYACTSLSLASKGGLRSYQSLGSVDLRGPPSSQVIYEADSETSLSLGLQIAQSRSYLHSLGPKVGIIYILGALGFGFGSLLGHILDGDLKAKVSSSGLRLRYSPRSSTLESITHPRSRTETPEASETLENPEEPPPHGPPWTLKAVAPLFLEP